jgi:O-antigen ligase
MFDDNNFYLKILNSFDEISITNGFELNANNSNYRSFESFAAIDTYLAGNWINYMVGHGFGKLVDLKIEIELASQDWQFIPVLHNGFMYILVKTGLLGILFFLLFFIKLYPAKDFKILPSEYDYLILVIKSLIVCCLVTNFVVSSFFNLEMEFLLICLGAFFNYFKRLSLYYVQ